MHSSTERQITGNTRVVAIIADPIGHVRTPQAFNALMAQRAADAVMVPFNVKPEHFARFIAAAPLIHNLVGLVVTIPYKETILAHCTGLTDAAQRMGAVNIVRLGDGQDGARSLLGGNFDGAGFVGGLLAQGHAVQGRRVYLAGAGGAPKRLRMHWRQRASPHWAFITAARNAPSSWCASCVNPIRNWMRIWPVPHQSTTRWPSIPPRSVCSRPIRCRLRRTDCRRVRWWPRWS